MIEYQCTNCGVQGVKLWREPGVFMSRIHPKCADCAVEHERIRGHIPASFTPWDVDKDGAHASANRGKVYTIGTLAPAIPTVDMQSFWGYLCTEPGRFKWWQRLPTLQPI